MIVLWVFLWILGAIILLFAIAVIAPISYNVKANVGGETSVLVRVGYCFRLIYFVYEYRESAGDSTLWIFGFRKNLDIFDSENEASEKKRRKKKSKAKPKKKSKKKDDKDEGGILDFLRSVLTYPHRKTIMGIIKQALKKLGKVMRPQKLDISGKVGLADPANTGFLLIAYEIFANMLRVRQNIQLTGDFESEEMTLAIDVFIKGHVSVARLTWPFLWLLLQKPVRGLVWKALKG